MSEKKDVTIYDVAKVAGVSVATVSRVINHLDQVTRKTQKKVFVAMDALSFDPNQHRKKEVSSIPSKITRKKNEQQLFVLSVPHLSNVFFLDIIDGAQTAAQKNGHHLLINNTPIRETNSDLYLSMLRTHGVSGIITTETIPTPALEKISSIFPVVQCSEYNDETDNYSYVAIDDTAASYQAVKFFVENGYRNIALFTTEFHSHFTVCRNRGYQMALSEMHIPFNPILIARFPDMNLNRSIMHAEAFLRKNKPDAIICVSDIFAAATIKAAEKLNIQVPNQLAIMGMDDIPIATSSSPSISSIRQPRYQLGYTAFEFLLEEYLHPQSAKHHAFLPTKIILRNSTQPSRSNTRFE